MNDVSFSPAIIIPSFASRYAAQDFEALPDGNAETFFIGQSEQFGDVNLSGLTLEAVVQNDHGYDDFENFASLSIVTTYPGINVNASGVINEPLGQATIIPFVYSYGYDTFTPYADGAVLALNLGVSSGDVTLEIGRFS